MKEIWNGLMTKGRYRNASLVLTAVLMSTMVLFGCTGAQEASAADSGMDFTFSNRDLNPSYEASEATKIVLSDQGITVTGVGAANVATSEDTAGRDVATISDEGTYIISGTLTNGRIVVNAEDTDKLQLVLSGANIHCSDNAALYIAKADKVFVTLAEGTQNSLSDGDSYQLNEEESSIDGTVYSKADLTINGNGALTVTGSYKHGIVSKDDLVITGGTLAVTANGQGLHGKDCVKIKDASITLKAQGDGIQSDNAENEARGFVYICSGTLNITVEGDAIQAETALRVDGGNITVKTGGGSAQTVANEKEPLGDKGGISGSENGMPGAGNGTLGGENSMSGSGISMPSGENRLPGNGNSIPGGGNGTPVSENNISGADNSRPEGGHGRFGGNAMNTSGEAKTAGKAENTSASAAAIQAVNTTAGETEAAKDDTVSTKGLKAGNELLIKGGTISIDSLDDGLHTNGSINIDGGTISIATGDDGIHADSDIVVNNGTITVSKSYEGLEGKTITVNGGTVDVTSSDDGFNATDGSGTSFPGMGGGRPGQGMNTQAATGQAIESKGGEGQPPTGQPAADQSSTVKSLEDQSSAVQPPTGLAAGNKTDKSDVYISITGGTVKADASGDGLDSNGDLRISGGTVIVSGPNRNGDGALDYDGTGTITGGVLMAAGNGGMAQSFSGGTPSQCSILYSLSETVVAGTKISLADSAGTEILSWTASKQFNCVQISSPKLEQGKTYTLKVGDTSVQITQDSVSVSNGGAAGGMNGGMRGNRQNGQNIQNSRNGQMQTLFTGADKQAI